MIVVAWGGGGMGCPLKKWQQFAVPIKIIFQTSSPGSSCPWVPVFLSNNKLFCVYPYVKGFSYGRLYPGRDEEDRWTLLQNLTSLLVNVQLWNTYFVALGIPGKSADRYLAKLECGEKLEKKPESGRKVFKLPVSAWRLLRQSCDRLGVTVRKLASKFELIKSSPGQAGALHWWSIWKTPNSFLARPCKCSLRTSNPSLVRWALHAVCATRSKTLHMSPHSTQWRIFLES